MLSESLQQYRYAWPREEFSSAKGWLKSDDGEAFVRAMPETEEELEADSRWPAMFPSPVCIVTTSCGDKVALEKVVGASIVNRFPYVIALSFCHKHLSQRHHIRSEFTSMLERGGTVAVQYLPPGPKLDAVMSAIASIPEERTEERIQNAGIATRRALTNTAPVIDGAYMVYEARLVRPGRDFSGQAIFEQPWRDVGSHRVYFLEINAIQLREDIARGEAQIHWRALPVWSPVHEVNPTRRRTAPPDQTERYRKGYEPHYSFPSRGTIAFETDEFRDGMAVKYLSPLAEDQVEVDNDRARWPCFFPSSAGMITLWTADGRPNVMPCGSTTILSRHPLVVAACISYAAINVRYAPRASLEHIRSSGRFGCGVPFISERIVGAIRYAGNVSFASDPDKIENAGLSILTGGRSPVIRDLPIHFDCRVVGEVRLGTHIMFLGEVESIRVRSDVSQRNALEWCPWADVQPVEQGRL